MGDQTFVCGRHKGRTFEDVAKNDPKFCEEVLKTTVCNKYYPEEFKLYLLAQGHPTMSVSSVADFVNNWGKDIEAEFRNIIGAPKIESKQVHTQASNYPNGNLGIFIRYFVKKCIFNVQNVNASSHCINTIASIFPFRVSRMVPAARLPVRELFDEKFYSTLAAFIVRHFEDRTNSANDIIDLFLRNVYDFKQRHFNQSATRRLKCVVDSIEDPDKSLNVPSYTADYLKQFPRLSKAGVTRYTQLRQTYNGLCSAFGLADLGDQHPRQIQKLPEINIYQLLQLLDSDFYTGDRVRYMIWFKKYLFFFVYAIDSADDHPIFFIDDPLYECLKYYTEYQSSREPPENLKLCIWMTTLVHRRTQPLNLKKVGLDFEVDDENLQHIRDYIENFSGIKSAKVDYGLPTSLLYLGVSIVTEDTVLRICYRKVDKPNLSDFHGAIIKALMCPFIVERIVMYNPYTGVETSMVVPPLKREVLEFIRRHNKYDAAYSKPVEYNLTENLEVFFVKDTIQWDEKCSRKLNSVPVFDYKEIFSTA